MKTFQYNLGGQTLTLRFDEKKGTVAEVLIDGKQHMPAESEMPAYAAAIALALIEHEVEIVHDDEPGFITVNRTESPWNAPAELMNQL